MRTIIIALIAAGMAGPVTAERWPTPPKPPVFDCNVCPPEQGPRGPRGPRGAQGDQGPPGADGATGNTGPRGAPGAEGIPGPRGADGSNGIDGAQGPRGLAGAPGNHAQIDYQSLVGMTAAVGAMGSLQLMDPDDGRFTYGVATSVLMTDHGDAGAFVVGFGYGVKPGAMIYGTIAADFTGDAITGTFGYTAAW